LHIVALISEFNIPDRIQLTRSLSMLRPTYSFCAPRERFQCAVHDAKS